MRLLRTVIICCCVLSATAARAQDAAPRALVVGLVIDERTREAISDVMVSLSTGAQARTDSTGHFALTSPRRGRLLIRFKKIGYDPGQMPITISEETTRVDVEMMRSVSTVAAADSAKTQLDTVSVHAEAVAALPPRLQEFEHRRMTWPNAVFITRADIEKHFPTLLTDMFRGMAQVSVIDSSGVKLIASNRGKKQFLLPTAGVGGNTNPMNPSKTMDIAFCYLRTGVDGQVKAWGFDMNTVRPEEVHGIEIFPGPAAIPAQYGGMRTDQFCGLVMIWTR